MAGTAAVSRRRAWLELGENIALSNATSPPISRAATSSKTFDASKVLLLASIQRRISRALPWPPSGSSGGESLHLAHSHFRRTTRRHRTGAQR